MEKIVAKTLNLNEIGIVNLTTDRSIPFVPFMENKTLGGFILIDKMTNATVAEDRNLKGLYAKARSGKLKNFT